MSHSNLNKTARACAPLAALIALACSARITDDAAPVAQAAAAVRCDPMLARYPVMGEHNNGYDSTAGNASLWSCGDANSNSDFIAGDHLGNDIWAAEGTPVVATVAGVLTLTGFSDYSGNKVTIIDDCGWYHFYAHLQSIAPGMADGVQVQAGDVVGAVGRTGTASNGVVHLHYSIYPAGNYDAGIDPWPALHAVEQNVCASGPAFAGTSLGRAGQSYPIVADATVTVALGETVTGWVKLTNSGTETWQPDVVELAPIPRDQPSPFHGPSWLSETRISTVASPVAPGAVGEFALDITGSALGESILELGWVAEGVTWFADGPQGGGPADGYFAVRVAVVEAREGDGGAEAGGGGRPAPSRDAGSAPSDAGDEAGSGSARDDAGKGPRRDPGDEDGGAEVAARDSGCRVSAPGQAALATQWPLAALALCVALTSSRRASRRAPRRPNPA
jgi:hypothetical protein